MSSPVALPPPWRYALIQDLPADRTARVLELAAERPWPVGLTDGNTRLTAYTAFADGDLLIRVLELAPDGSDATEELSAAAWSRFLAAATGVAEVATLEAEIAGYAAPDTVAGHDPRQLATALRGVSVVSFAGRATAPDLLPDTGIRRRAVLRYPVRPGRGAHVEEALSGGRNLPVQATSTTALASTSLFRRGDLVLRLVEVVGDLSVGFAHLRATASRGPAAAHLPAHLHEGYDLRTPGGFDRFLATGLLPLLVHEQATDTVATTSLPRRNTP